MDFTIKQLQKIKEKIKIVPHGFNPSIFKKIKVDKKDDKFTFVANKGWRGTANDRGGMQFLLQAFAEEFRKEEKVKLMVKINTAYAPDLDIPEAMKVLGIKQGTGHADILINTEQTTLEEVNKLYNSGDVFVSTSMAEGFNLPVIESMACGLPVIVTKFGGHMDFVNKSNGLIIEEGEMIDVKGDLQYEGIKWFKPSIKDIRKKLRYAFEHQSEMKKLGENSYKKSEEYTWSNSAKKLLEVLKQ